MPDSLTDWQTLNDRATQLLKKYKSGALVTQWQAPERLADLALHRLAVTSKFPETETLKQAMTRLAKGPEELLSLVQLVIGSLVG